MNFQVYALAIEQFQPFFAMNTEELASHNARRLIADKPLGYPCRVSLRDAAIGEHVLLLPFVYHQCASPYRASGPIFVRENSVATTLAPNQLPGEMETRQMSVRAYDAEGMIKMAEVVEGERLVQYLQQLLQGAAIAYVHLHYAGYGCYACKVVRSAEGAGPSA
ncbi:DUF1203 domain-containing protein [Janthinobacterium sp. B9-8]|uniref:DUF1203 domain-containing protein n=1 Tax=Janthinobacterium sp. B9-8 TaxID=1236179 RepID=UPI00061D0154|nr:DUF1203 domain-containing protein [Janthinobacterium sp. B9-8]AMC35528.1 hypothetical protein VN23_13340 [Janthinobacterium sp. B9-8]